MKHNGHSLLAPKKQSATLNGGTMFWLVLRLLADQPDPGESPAENDPNESN